jgi:hypothetical protein
MQHLLRTQRLWMTLLRREKRFAIDAPVAERALATMAEKLDEMGDIFGRVLGDPKNVYSRRATTLWRTLHRFSPGTELYLKKLRPPDTKGQPESDDTGPGH